jgi:acetolactate synthase-1/2/3 large subunit
LRPHSALRQRGFQETDVVSIFSSITKYAKLVRKPDDIRYELEKAVFLARSGRPGPVLLDIPDDLQRQFIEPANLRSFDSAQDTGSSRACERVTPQQIRALDALIASSKRPVVIVGAGVHLSETEDSLKEFIEHYRLPVLLTWGAIDLFPRDHPLNLGGLGVVGPRSGNFAAQNADLVIALGTRLSQMIVGGKPELFAPLAKKVLVDIDREEIAKFQTAGSFSLELAIHGDLRDFFDQATKARKTSPSDRWVDWRKQVATWESDYPVCLPAYDEETSPHHGGQVNAYVFMRELSAALAANDIVITDAGGNLCWTMQGIRAKAGQRIFSAWNHSPMGYSLPAAMGAAVASSHNVICIIGDGGLMMCLSELGTIRRHNWPIKIFLFNNRGHGIQKQTMETWMNSRYVGVDEQTGLFFPSYQLIANAFGLRYVPLSSHRDLKNMRELLSLDEPVLIDVHISVDQRITPMLKFGSGIEDLDPKLPAHEIDRIMSISKG